MNRLAYDQKDAAAQLSVAVNTFVKNVRPHVPSVQVGPCRRWLATDLQRWLERQR